jgi:hypothetical protein
LVLLESHIRQQQQQQQQLDNNNQQPATSNQTAPKPEARSAPGALRFAQARQLQLESESE